LTTEKVKAFLFFANCHKLIKSIQDLKQFLLLYHLLYFM